MQGLDEAARAFIKLFEQLGVPYVLMGGLAVRIYALPRPTFDVDFTALLHCRYFVYSRRFRFALYARVGKQVRSC